MGISMLVSIAALVAVLAPHDGPGVDRLYGRVVTTEGAVYEGWIRWDGNEVSPTDFLDAGKEIALEVVREAERLDPDFAAAQKRARSLVAFGVRLTWDEDDEVGPPVVPSAIRLGHVVSIAPIDARNARVVLRSGEEVVLRSTSSDLGRGMRAIEIESGGEPVREVRWSDVERVDFSTPPTGASSPSSPRLYGTLTTWAGLELTGAISWDLDEVLASDVLDGRVAGRDREIAFAEIATIERESDRSALVTLRTGEALVMRGSNDVDRRNRGIEVSDPFYGRAVASWADFRSIRFHSPDGPGPWPERDPSASLRGTVRAVDGRVIEGEIRWGNDEEFAWETLDGWLDDLELSVEFGAIASVVKTSDDGVSVTLRDGRVLLLAGTDDVGVGHGGVFVKPEGRQRRLVRWRDLQRVDFTW